MPYSNANDVVVDMAKEVIPVVKHTPVIAGVCGTDPFKDMPRFLVQLRDLGFAVRCWLVVLWERVLLTITSPFSGRAELSYRYIGLVTIEDDRPWLTELLHSWTDRWYFQSQP
jgi:hypothetical protein